jgi:hypothetical protein
MSGYLIKKMVGTSAEDVIRKSTQAALILSTDRKT